MDAQRTIYHNLNACKLYKTHGTYFCTKIRIHAGPHKTSLKDIKATTLLFSEWLNL